MAKVTLEVPNALSDLPGDERDLLLNRALRSATKERIEQVEHELGECEDKVDSFTEKYHMDFDAFEKGIKAREFEGVDVQEDYHEWYFWRECKGRTKDVLRSLRRAIEP